MTHPASPAHRLSSILVVDDELRTREVIRKYLEVAGFRVIEAEDSDQVFRALGQHHIDLIILDVMLPGRDGFTITQLLRERTMNAVVLANKPDLPIILLTARRDEVDRVFGFEVGADDYVVKPFSPRELVGRVKAVLRRCEPHIHSVPTTLQFGAYEIDSSSRTLTRQGIPITLTRKDFDLLFFLVSHPNQVFSYEQILSQLWADAPDLDSSVVTSRIYRLREKIETDPDNPGYLQTVWGVGYKFHAD